MTTIMPPPPPKELGKPWFEIQDGWRGPWKAGKTVLMDLVINSDTGICSLEVLEENDGEANIP